MDTTQRTVAALRRALLLALLGFAPGAWSPAAAQGEIRAASVQPLSFGTIFPGLAEVVRITDTLRRGTVTLEGTGTVQVAMILPGEMVSPEGHRVPLSFGFGAGGIATSATAAPTPFDPAQPQRFTLTGSDHTVWIYLGGTASVPDAQPPGRYTATVVVTVTRPNT